MRKSDSVGRAIPPRVQMMSVLLTLAAGAVNAICFVSLGGAFASVMTGNMIVLGLAIGTADAAQALSAGLAFVGYVTGTLLAAGLTRRLRRPGRSSSFPIPVTLLVEFAVLAGLAIFWEVLDGHLAGTAPRVILVLAAMAMGLQSAAVASLGVQGLSTTYMTGTLTRLLMGIAGTRGGSWVDLWSLGRLVALIAGAIAGAVLIDNAILAVPLIALAAVGITLVLAAVPTFRRVQPAP